MTTSGDKPEVPRGVSWERLGATGAQPHHAAASPLSFGAAGLGGIASGSARRHVGGRRKPDGRGLQLAQRGQDPFLLPRRGHPQGPTALPFRTMRLLTRSARPHPPPAFSKLAGPPAFHGARTGNRPLRQTDLTQPAPAGGVCPHPEIGATERSHGRPEAAERVSHHASSQDSDVAARRRTSPRGRPTATAPSPSPSLAPKARCSQPFKPE